MLLAYMGAIWGATQAEWSSSMIPSRTTRARWVASTWADLRSVQRNENDHSQYGEEHESSAGPHHQFDQSGAALVANVTAALHGIVFSL